MTTPTNHVLIDYENVQPDLAARLSPSVFKVWVFVGATQSELKYDLVELLQAKGSDAKVIKTGGVGKNALDFEVPSKCAPSCDQRYLAQAREQGH
ncbi:PIN domain-containing protein [Hydrogenophaga sp. T2]|uniref:PIN domain-containing protein n=1 Tax=Hydrogenophaga sp. T2 TaxID=3132823 RepID=UPI003CF11D51